MDRGNVGIDLWHESIMQCPSHFPFTTLWSERGDRVRWILIDSFGFPEIISPRMHQGNWISNYPSPPPCLFPLSRYLLRLQKPCMNWRLPDQKVLHWRHCVTPSCVSDNRGWNQRHAILNKTVCAMSGSVSWHKHSFDLPAAWGKKKKKKTLPWALNTMVTFTHSYWNEKKKTSLILTLLDQKVSCDNKINCHIQPTLGSSVQNWNVRILKRSVSLTTVELPYESYTSE